MKNLIFLFFLTAALTLSAQTDQKAKSMLEETSKKMQSFQTISAKFTFTMENARMNIKEQNTGSLLLKGKKYQVKLPDMGMQVYSDGKTVWNYMKDANQVTISNAGDEGQGVIDPTTIFNVYQEGYTQKFIEEKSVNGKTMAYIELYPQDKTKEFTKMTVGIDKARMVVGSLVTHGKDGNQYGIFVSDFKTNIPLADTEFTFHPSMVKDVEVVDFR